MSVANADTKTTQSAIHTCAVSELRSIMKTKGEVYLAVMVSLFESGTPRHKCSVEGKAKVEDQMWEIDGKPYNLPRSDFRVNPSGWYKAGNKAGFTDQKYARHTTNKPKAPQSVSKNTSKKTKLSYAQLNAKYIDVLTEHRERVDQVIDIMRKHEVEKLVNDKSLCRIFLAVGTAVNQNIADLAGNRQMILRNGQPLFVQMISGYSNNNKLVSAFLVEVKRIFMALRVQSKGAKNTKKRLPPSTLSQKAITNLRKRNLRDLHHDLEYKSPEYARLHGFTGHACPRCKYYRCVPGDIDPRKNKCVVCSYQYDEPDFVVPDLISCASCDHVLSDTEFTDDPAKCPSCGEHPQANVIA